MDSSFFFFNDTATTEIYTLSLHDALPICGSALTLAAGKVIDKGKQLAAHLLEAAETDLEFAEGDRKSTRLNSSHSQISYAVFCLKKKTKTKLSARHSEGS